jgi:acetyl-CoA C-acetyltransferase/acetyl-CoA acyltransferase
MRQVAAVGVGMTKFGVSDKTSVEMFAQAALEAIDDAKIKTKDIQSLFLGNVFGGFEEGQAVMAPFSAAYIGLPHIPATRFEGACASGAIAVRDAIMWVASGYYDVVIAGGTERCSTMGTSFATRVFGMGSDSHYEWPMGITFPGVFALIAHLYSSKYNIPLPTLKEQMARVAVKNHDFGSRNPLGHLPKKINIEDVLNSMMIADPLQLYDCCPFSDGAAAIVIASYDTAKKITDKPVKVIGFGLGSNGSITHQKDITVIEAREKSAKEAYAMAGITPDDIDICELHDCFTIAEIVATEALGFFPYGEGSKAVEKGLTGPEGKVVVNPSGGLKSKGHPIGATGAAQAYEIVKQLRGECGERQIDGATTGMTDTLGGDLCTVCNIIYQKGW